MDDAVQIALRIAKATNFCGGEEVISTILGFNASMNLAHELSNIALTKKFPSDPSPKKFTSHINKIRNGKMASIIKNDK